ncbi:MAG: putative Ig domain-containing protein, partial [Planctomycetota bacterium]
MSSYRILPVLVIGTLLFVIPACGGGGQGYRMPDQSIQVVSTAIPDAMSGEPVSHVIPLAGGCPDENGNYDCVLSVISGRLPDGITLNDETHTIEGVLLEHSDDPFVFEIQVVDSNCQPFSATTARFSWNVDMGEVRVVATNPPLTPAGATPENPLHPALPDTVFSTFSSINMIIAGGEPPYTCELWDVPGVEETGLPQGMILSQDSCTFVGTPGESGPPFVVSIRVTDRMGREGFFTAQWKIVVPPLIIATPAIDDGKCGETYSATVSIVDGVGPFDYNLVEAMVNMVPHPDDPTRQVPDCVWDPDALVPP